MLDYLGVYKTNDILKQSLFFAIWASLISHSYKSLVIALCNTVWILQRLNSLPVNLGDNINKTQPLKPLLSLPLNRDQFL